VIARKHEHDGRAQFRRECPLHEAAAQREFFEPAQRAERLGFVIDARAQLGFEVHRQRGNDGRLRGHKLF